MGSRRVRAAVAAAVVTAVAAVAAIAGGVGGAAAATGSYDIRESLSVRGTLTAGSTAELLVTLSNVGTGDFNAISYQFGETRPRAGFGEIVLPASLKRQVPAANLQTDNPLILCEAYRGTHGGLSKADYSDACRIWWYGDIPAGGSVSAVIPVKLLAEGDVTPWAGAVIYETVGTTGTSLGTDWITTTFHVGPAPVKTVTGGGTALPDLQAGGKASTGSPARGAYSYVLLTARNSGKADAADASITAVVPAGVTIDWASLDFGSCTVAGQVITCSTAHPIWVGMTETLAIYFWAPTAPGAFGFSGTWSTAAGESSLANNTSTVSITVK